MRISDWSSDVCSSDLGGAYLQCELKDIRDGTKLNERFRASEDVERVRLDQKDYQYLYIEGDMLTFMDNETYEQISVHEDLVGEPVVFLQEGMTVTIESYEEEPISVMLPDTVVMKIVEADPVVKGQTASKSEEHTSELQSLMRKSYAVCCLKKKRQ